MYLLPPWTHFLKACLGMDYVNRAGMGHFYHIFYEGMDYADQVGVGHFYHIFYEGCLTNFEVGEEAEASKLYPDVQYVRMDEYLKQYL
ncbi:hypothetical protein L1049_022781 [Liquidambar formosana]|uniref:Uncharacterized protein n=1 Tax=Liquidambar formosana TaxID=63359 RepID=A0AAP0WPE4_LIQFO